MAVPSQLNKMKQNKTNKKCSSSKMQFPWAKLIYSQYHKLAQIK